MESSASFTAGDPPIIAGNAFSIHWGRSGQSIIVLSVAAPGAFVRCALLVGVEIANLASGLSLEAGEVARATCRDGWASARPGRVSGYDTGWRCLLAADDSPWYSILRQFRHFNPAGCDQVIARGALAAEIHRKLTQLDSITIYSTGY